MTKHDNETEELKGVRCSAWLGTVLVFAARYAHSRQTGAALAVVSAVKASWPKLDEYTKDQILRESHEATCNSHDWESLREFAEDSVPNDSSSATRRDGRETCVSTPTDHARSVRCSAWLGVLRWFMDYRYYQGKLDAAYPGRDVENKKTACRVAKRGSISGPENIIALTQAIQSLDMCNQESNETFALSLDRLAILLPQNLASVVAQTLDGLSIQGVDQALGLQSGNQPPSKSLLGVLCACGHCSPTSKTARKQS